MSTDSAEAGVVDVFSVSPPPDVAYAVCEAEIPEPHYRLNHAVAVSEMR
jgi:hypothetical protein